MENRGKLVGVNKNLITVEFEGNVKQNEIAYAILGESRLKAEVIRIRKNRADLQVFEDTRELKMGDVVEFTGELLSIELGPGLLGELYDGLQNPLHELVGELGFFLQRGKYINALPEEIKWEFVPCVKPGEILQPADAVGTVNWSSGHRYICGVVTIARLCTTLYFGHRSTDFIAHFNHLCIFTFSPFHTLDWSHTLRRMAAHQCREPERSLSQC